MRRHEIDLQLRHQNELLVVRNELLTLQKQVAEAQSGQADAGEAMRALETTSCRIGGHPVPLRDLFMAMSDLLATGATLVEINQVASFIFLPKLGLSIDEPPGQTLYYQGGFTQPDVIGRLVIYGFIHQESVDRFHPGTTTFPPATAYFLTDLGREVAGKLRLSPPNES